MGSLLPGRRGLRPSARAARRERARAARAAAARRRGRDDVTRRRCAAPLAASLRPASLRLLCPPALRARGADRPRVPDPRRSQAAPGARGADQLERCGALALPLPSRSPTASSTAASARPPASPPSPPRPRRHPLPRRRPRRRHQAIAAASAPRRAADDLPVPGPFCRKVARRIDEVEQGSVDDCAAGPSFTTQWLVITSHESFPSSLSLSSRAASFSRSPSRSGWLRA